MPLSGNYFYPGIAGANIGALRNVVISNNNELYNYKALINVKTGSYDLQASDTGRLLEFSSSAGGRIYLPSSLSGGFCCTLVSITGTWHVSASAGATLTSFQNLTKSAGDNAELTIYVSRNTNGTNAIYVLGGNTA